MPGIAERVRQQEILQLLDAHGRVRVAQLAERFGVSAVTVRKDLESLERSRLLERVRGGAVPRRRVDEGPFAVRLRQRAEQKRAIAAAAAELVHDGDAIALDSSTTCFYLAQLLRDRRGLVVVTNGLEATSVLSESDEITVVLSGGVVRRSSRSVVGDIGDVLASRGRLVRGFFGLRGLSTTTGLMELSEEETTVKRRLVAACGEVYALFDASKVEQFALHPFAEPDRVTELVTDEGAPEEFVASWRAAGVRVRRVSFDEVVAS